MDYASSHPRLSLPAQVHRSDDRNTPTEQSETPDAGPSANLMTDEELEAIAAAEEAELHALLELHEASQQAPPNTPELPPMLDSVVPDLTWLPEHPSSEASRYGLDDENEFESALAEMSIDDMDTS